MRNELGTLKMRAWDKEKGKYNYFCLENIIPSMDEFRKHLIDGDEFYLFTGLKDKKNKEIFEGDIVKVPYDLVLYGLMAGEEREVYFKDGGFRLKPKTEYRGQRGFWLEDTEDIEIIGNIHEQEKL